MLLGRVAKTVPQALRVCKWPFRFPHGLRGSWPEGCECYLMYVVGRGGGHSLAWLRCRPPGEAVPAPFPAGCVLCNTPCKL